MRDAMRSASALARRVFGLVVLFAVLRIIVGIVLIGFTGAIDRSLEVTLICAIAVVVYVGVALAVRRWSPQRRIS